MWETLCHLVVGSLVCPFQFTKFSCTLPRLCSSSSPPTYPPLLGGAAPGCWQPPADGKSPPVVCSAGRALLRGCLQSAGAGAWLWQGSPRGRCLCCRWPRGGWPPRAIPPGGREATSAGVRLPPALRLCQGTSCSSGLRDQKALRPQCQV